MVYQLVQTEANYIAGHHLWDNPTINRKNDSEPVIFSLEELMDLEFKSCLCICEHEYLELVKVTLFVKMIDHNLIYDHNLFACQE